MKALTAPLRYTLFIVFLTLAVITHSHAAMSPELTSALQKKRLTEEDKVLINQSEELQAFYQYLLIDRDLSNELTINVNKIDAAKIPTTKMEHGFSDYIPAIIGENRQRRDGVMVDKDGKIRHLKYRPQTQEDINFLSRFKKLNQLYLQSYSEQLKHVSLANLTALKELHLNLGYTEKLNFGEDTLPLSTILIANENIKTLANIKNLENLQYLTVLPSSISDYTELEHNKTLKHLSIDATTQIKLPNFSNLKNLHYLDITAKESISDLSLKNCKNLTEVILRPVRLETIEFPSSIKKLFSDGINKKEDLSNLSHLSNLEDLSLGYTLINSLKGIPHLKNLKRLELDGNKINSLDGLNRFRKLQELAIYSGGLTETPDLTQHPDLKNLTLKNQKLEKLCHTKTWKNVEKINLRDNEIKKLDGLRHLTSLKEMDLRGNPLREVSQTDLDALVKKEFEGYINVTRTEFGVDIMYDDELIKKYYFFEDPEYR